MRLQRTLCIFAFFSSQFSQFLQISFYSSCNPWGNFFWKRNQPPGRSSLSIWTEAELDEQIATWKQILLTLAKFKEVTAPDGRRLTLKDSPNDTLRYFEKDKKKLAGTTGPSINARRSVKWTCLSLSFLTAYLVRVLWKNLDVPCFRKIFKWRVSSALKMEHKKLFAKEMLPESEHDPDFKPFDPYRPSHKTLKRPDLAESATPSRTPSK